MAFVDRVRHALEAAPAYLALWTVPLLSRRGAVGLARFLGSAAYVFARRDRTVALANLDLAFGSSLSRRQKKQIAGESFRSFALVLIDFFWFSRSTRSRVEKYVTFDKSTDPYFSSPPVIVVTAHLGNWETMGLGASQRGAPPVSVAMPLENPTVNGIIGRLRRKTGQLMAEREGAIKILLKALKGGGRVALLLDQNTLPAEGGIFVKFFGLPVPVSNVAATLAPRTDAKVFFAYCIPDENGVYSAHGDLIPVEPVAQLTERLAAALEQVVREHPGKWLWMYKRWKFVPAGASAADYPWYARAATQAEEKKMEN